MSVEERATLLCKFISYEVLLGLYGAKGFIEVKDTEDKDKLEKIREDLRSFYVVNNTFFINTIAPQNHLRLKNYVSNMLNGLYFTKWEEYDESQIQEILISRSIELYKEILIYQFDPSYIKSNTSLNKSFQIVHEDKNFKGLFPNTPVEIVEDLVRICKDILYKLETIDNENDYSKKLDMDATWANTLRAVLVCKEYEERVIKYLNQRLEYYNVSEEESKDLPTKEEVGELSKEEILNFSVATLMSSYSNIIEKYPDMKLEVLEEFNKKVEQFNTSKAIDKLKK